MTEHFALDGVILALFNRMLSFLLYMSVCTPGETLCITVAIQTMQHAQQQNASYPNKM
jgi:hypothetical protein